MSRLDEWKAKISYQSALLAGFALLASGLLGLADFNTREVIQLRMDEDLSASLAEVVPHDLYDNNLLQDTVQVTSSGEDELGVEKTQVYLARKDGELKAVSFRFIATGGYSGDISLIMGIDVDGNILGVRVIAHSETPGLGDKIETSKSNWVHGFDGRSLDNLTKKQWAVKKDGGVFDQFSGATITPRAVVKGVYHGLQFFKHHKAELLNAQLAGDK